MHKLSRLYSNSRAWRPYPTKSFILTVLNVSFTFRSIHDMVPMTPACTWWYRPKEDPSSSKLKLLFIHIRVRIAGLPKNGNRVPIVGGGRGGHNVHKVCQTAVTDPAINSSIQDERQVDQVFLESSQSCAAKLTYYSTEPLPPQQQEFE